MQGCESTSARSLGHAAPYDCCNLRPFARCPLLPLRTHARTLLHAPKEAGIKTADAVVLVPPIRDMERWCSRQGHHKVTSRIREADAMVMAGLIQVGNGMVGP